MTDAAREYCRLWRELDRLIQADEGETDSADELREQMDDPWWGMTDAERELARDDVRWLKGER